MSPVSCLLTLCVVYCYLPPVSCLLSPRQPYATGVGFPRPEPDLTKRPLTSLLPLSFFVSKRIVQCKGMGGDGMEWSIQMCLRLQRACQYAGKIQINQNSLSLARSLFLSLSLARSLSLALSLLTFQSKREVIQVIHSEVDSLLARFTSYQQHCRHRS